MRVFMHKLNNSITKFLIQFFHFQVTLARIDLWLLLAMTLEDGTYIRCRKHNYLVYEIYIY